MKLIIFSLLSFVLVSCSSDPVTETSGANSAPVEKKTVESKKIEEVPAPVVEKKTSAETAARYTSLDAAISSENLERIKQASTELLSSNPKDVKALNALGIYYYKKGQLDAAKLLLNKAWSVSPTTEISNNLGLVALAQGHQREAVQMFKKSIEIDSKNADAASNLGALYIKERDYNKAIFALEPIVKAGKADTNTLSNYGVALAATDKVKEAADVYEKILSNQPDHQNTMLNYSILMIEKQEKYKEGLDLINRLKFVGSDIESRQVIKDLENKAKAGLK